MKTTEKFSNIQDEQLRSINGGGFAYDLGRAIRFLGLSGGGVTITNALIDWWVNDFVNEVTDE